MNPWKINEISDMLEQMEQAKEKDEQYLIYVAEKNKNNCELCLENHGKRFRASDLSRPALPIHPNCHCHYEILNAESSKKNTIRSATVRVEGSYGIGGFRVASIDDMLDELEKNYVSGTLAELIISGHGGYPGRFHIGSDDLIYLSPTQTERLKRLLSSDAIIDIRMCYGALPPNGPINAQKIANKLGVKIRGYAGPVSPLGTVAFPNPNLYPLIVSHQPQIFYPQK